MNTIYYNNLNVFSGIAPTPLVQLSEEPVRYGNLWAIAETITLNGQLTGKCQTFSQLLAKQNSLISNFSSGFKPLTIDQDGSTIYSWPITKVKNISFSPARYSQLLDFSIVLECYDSGKFSGYYGIIEPKNEIIYANQENGFVTLTHNCSAKGINTNTSATGALLNAKNYVSTISGWDNISGFTPAFISGTTGFPPILSSLKETIDRFNNVYSLSETWTYDPAYAQSGLLRFTNSIKSGVQDGVIEVAINGSVEGGKNLSIGNVRTRFVATNVYNLASGALTDFSTQPLNQSPLSLSISEDSFQNVITFDYTYDNNPESNPYLISTISINKSKTSRSSASFDGTFKFRGNCMCNNESGWSALESIANNYDYYSATLTKWTGFGMVTNLSSYPNSTSITKNKNSCEISVNMSFQEIVLDVPDELEYIDVTLDIQPSVLKYDAKPVMEQGTWYVLNLGYRNRAKYSINGSARIKACTDQAEGLEVIRSYINTLAGEYVIGTDKVLEAGSIQEQDSDNKLINFNFTWSALGAEFTI